MNLAQVICCRCKNTFTNIDELEDHAYQEYISVSRDIEHNFCGFKIWFCYSCEQYFKSYNLYQKHFKVKQKCPLLDHKHLLMNFIFCLKR